MDKSKIDWCTSTWNPVTGCRNDCHYCYARSIAQRFQGYDGPQGLCTTPPCETPILETPLRITWSNGRTVQAPYPFGFVPTLHKYRLDEYLDRSPRNIFVGSTADIFGDWVPDEWLDLLFSRCLLGSQHNYLFLTKNPDRYRRLMEAGRLPQKDFMWYGTTVTAPGQDYFREKKYHTYLSIEPLIQDVKLRKTKLSGIEWAIIGGMTGPDRRNHPPTNALVRSTTALLREVRIPVFQKDNLGSYVDGRLIRQMPPLLAAKASGERTS